MAAGLLTLAAIFYLANSGLMSHQHADQIAWYGGVIHISGSFPLALIVFLPRLYRYTSQWRNRIYLVTI